jgi:hypothetical protein
MVDAKVFNEVMKARHEEMLKANPGKTPMAIGLILLPPYYESLWPFKIIQVECCNCGIPIYVTEWVYNEIQGYFDLIHKDKHPYYCDFCVPNSVLKGTFLQDMSFIMNHFGGLP